MSTLKLVEPLTHAGTHAGDVTAEEHYPRHVVIPGVLAFCLASWALVIVAVRLLGA